MSEHGEQFRAILNAIRMLSESQGKMTVEDIKNETGIQSPEETLDQLNKRGFIYYVNSSEFKLTP